MHAATTTELLEACSVLFGEGIAVTPAFLKILQPSGIKSAYRQRVLETHPDQALRLGVDENVLSEEFKRLNQAYECLRSMLRRDRRGPTGPTTRRHPRGRDADACAGRFYSGTLPQRSLPLGQFLYYSGAISWQDLVQAILWQRSSRPRIGHIARQWGLLSQRDIRSILSAGPMSEKFGERALRHGYLTPFQVLALLGQQKKRRCLIGRYFLRHRLLTAPVLIRYLAAQRLHNKGCRSTVL